MNTRKSKPAKKTPKTPANSRKSGSSIWSLAVIAAVILIFIWFIRGGFSPSGAAEPAKTPGITPQAASGQKINLTVLTDGRCGQACSYSTFLTNIRKNFPNLNVRQLDYGSAEGKALYDNLSLTVLPAFIFDTSVLTSAGYSNMTDYFDAAGDRLLLRVNSPWDPICDAAAEHCGEPRCAGRISCRKEIAGQVVVFSTSLSQQGMKAIDSMKGLLSAFRGEINFTVGYIGEFDYKGNPTSPNGQPEIDEDLRQLCAMGYYRDGLKFMDYIWCRNGNMSGNWTDCANAAGMNATVIGTCATGGEGMLLLNDSFRESRQLEIIDAPTFLMNNKRRFFNAITPQQIQAGICSQNKGLVGCATNLTGTDSK